MHENHMTVTVQNSQRSYITVYHYYSQNIQRNYYICMNLELLTRTLRNVYILHCPHPAIL